MPRLILARRLLAARGARRVRRRLQPDDLHPRQRARGRGGREPPRAGRLAHGVVPRRLGRRAAGQVRPRAFPRAPDVQGHQDGASRRSSPRSWRANGGEDNAFTTYDYTAYFQSIAKDKLELVMRLEADRMQNLVLTDAEVLPEREVVREERRTRTENRPSARAGRAGERGVLSQPSLRPAGDRLDARDRGAHHRERARVLQALLHAQQRGASSLPAT